MRNRLAKPAMAAEAGFAAGQILRPLSACVVPSAGGGFSAALLFVSEALAARALLPLRR